jgi:hypothetical protein
MGLETALFPAEHTFPFSVIVICPNSPALQFLPANTSLLMSIAPPIPLFMKRQIALLTDSLRYNSHTHQVRIVFHLHPVRKAACNLSSGIFFILSVAPARSSFVQFDNARHRDSDPKQLAFVDHAVFDRIFEMERKAVPVFVRVFKGKKQGVLIYRPYAKIDDDKADVFIFYLYSDRISRVVYRDQFNRLSAAGRGQHSPFPHQSVIDQIPDDNRYSREAQPSMLAISGLLIPCFEREDQRSNFCFLFSR